MKHARKLATLLLALVMVFALATTAFAAENATISAPEGSTRNYDVYQIFTGDLHEGVLSNVKWGKNGTGKEGDAVDQATLDALTAVNSESDTKKLTEIQKYVNLTSEKFGMVSNGNSLTVPTGYYLIKDNGPVGDGESFSLYVVQVVGPTTISPKVGTTTSEKKVKDTNDTTGTTSDWQDSADYDIGDSVPFQLKATLANNVSSYTTYKVVFHDTLSKGLTLDATYAEGTNTVTSGVTVKMGEENVTSHFTITAEVNEKGETILTVECDDVKKFGAGNSSVITVEYTATLNTNAVPGSAGNPNKVKLEYSNNPNKSETGNNETGETPEDVVIVFTYKTIVNKVTKNPDYNPEVGGSEEYIPLKGAGFTLYKKNTSGEYVKVGEELKGDDMTTFTWSGLDDGDYKLVETTTPAGYNTIAPIEFTITAEHEVKSDNPTLTSLSGEVTSGTAATGVVNFTPNTDNGSLSTKVVNNSGTQLPETGGMGTTLFYVLGSVLVLAAVVLLVTKKRVSMDG